MPLKVLCSAISIQSARYSRKPYQCDKILFHFQDPRSYMTRASTWNAKSKLQEMEKEKNKRNTFTTSAHIQKQKPEEWGKNGDKISWTAKWQSKYTSSIVHLANKSKVIFHCCCCCCSSSCSCFHFIRHDSPCHPRIIPFQSMPCFAHLFVFFGYIILFDMYLLYT